MSILFAPPEPHPLKAIMKSKDITAAAVANHLGVSCTYLYGLLSGRLNPGQDMETKLYEIMEMLKQEGAEIYA